MEKVCKMFDYLNHVNDLYPVRRSKEEKERFQKFVLEEAKKANLNAEIEQVKEHQNIIIGTPETAKVIFTAHYDTPAASIFPNIMMPRNIILGMIYQLSYPILLSLLSLVVAYVIAYILDQGVEVAALIYIILFLGSFYLLTRAFPNKHNKNDNTSGVAAILSLMMKCNNQNAAFILFDNEEKGLLGSKAYNKQHKEMLENKMVINLDCVGFGNNVIFISKKDAENHQYYNTLKNQVLSTNEYLVHFFGTKGSMSNSDYKNFKCGIGVMTCRKSSLVGFYTSRIHTKFDTVANSRNIEFITTNLTEFINKL